MTLACLIFHAMLAKQKKHRRYLGRAGKPWTEQEKQEVKATYLRKELIRGIATRHERKDGGAPGRGSGDGAYVPARRPREGWN